MGFGKIVDCGTRALGGSGGGTLFFTSACSLLDCGCGSGGGTKTSALLMTSPSSFARSTGARFVHQLHGEHPTNDDAKVKSREETALDDDACIPLRNARANAQRSRIHGNFQANAIREEKSRDEMRAENF
jgi:hypothetical protein